MFDVPVFKSSNSIEALNSSKLLRSPIIRSMVCILGMLFYIFSTNFVVPGLLYIGLAYDMPGSPFGPDTDNPGVPGGPGDPGGPGMGM